MSTPWHPLPKMQVQLLVRNVASKTQVRSSSSSSKLIHSCVSVGVDGHGQARYSVRSKARGDAAPENRAGGRPPGGTP